MQDSTRRAGRGRLHRRRLRVHRLCGVSDVFYETPTGDITIALAADGACPGASTVTASFNAATSFYNGSWTHTDAGACGGATTGGALLGGRDMGTRSAHVASVLANLGQLADDIEDGAAFGSTHAALAPGYLHFGETAADFLAARNAEVTAHPDAQVELHSFTSIRTVTPAGHNPMLSSTLGVTFADERRDGSGIYRSATAGAPAQSGYYYLVEDAGAWRLNGNQVGPFDLPFAYTVGAERLIVPTSIAGAPLHLSLGGWGAHFGPQTGHLEGNAKIDMMAQFVGGVGDLTELASDPSGTPDVCDQNLVWAGTEICGVWGGLSGELIRARIFTYRAPYSGTVTEVAYEERPRPASAPETHYFDNVAALERHGRISRRHDDPLCASGSDRRRRARRSDGERASIQIRTRHPRPLALGIIVRPRRGAAASMS